MGKRPKEKPKRDKNLIKDYLKMDAKGNPIYTVSELCLKYANEKNGRKIPLSNTRFYQILGNHDINTNRR